MAHGAAMLSLGRGDRIRGIRLEGRVALVEAGGVLARLHQAAEAEDLVVPLTLGAEGSAMIGGVLGTNAGASDVLRPGGRRSMCLDLEAVLAGGRILDVHSAVNKGNTGCAFKDRVIGAEGTPGIITAATLEPVAGPSAHATVAAPWVRDALGLLHHLQDAAGGTVSSELPPFWADSSAWPWKGRACAWEHAHVRRRTPPGRGDHRRRWPALLAGPREAAHRGGGPRAGGPSARSLGATAWRRTSCSAGGA